MNPADAIIRPRWHDAPGFNAAWLAVQRCASNPILTEHDRAWVLGVAASLHRCRVLKVTGLQVEAIHAAGKRGDALTYGQWLSNIHLPFDPLFCEIDYDGHAVSVLASRDNGALVCVPFVQGGGFLTHYAVVRDDGRLKIGAASSAGSAMLQESKKGIEGQVTSLRHVLHMLQAANVDLAEPQLRRQSRRQAERKHEAVPLEIVVRRPTSYSRPRGGTITYSHAHDRAGNFAHHFELTREGTPNVWFERWQKEAPERAVTIDGRPCFMVWRQATIVGIGDGPYVYKSRTMEAA
jgi:hypothetical protein